MKPFKKLLKEKFLTTLIIDILFFIISFFSLKYIYNTLSDKIYSLALYAPELQQISGQLQEQSLETADLTLLATKLDLIQNLTGQITLLLILLPISAIILYFIFQGTSWNYILNKKVLFNKTFFTKFSLLTLIFIIPPFIFFQFFFDKFMLGNAIAISIIISLISIYLAFVSYNLAKYKLKKILKQTFIIGFKRSVKLFSIIIATFALMTLSFFLLRESFILQLALIVGLYTLFKLVFYYILNKK